MIAHVPDPYKTLGVARDASAGDLKRAFRVQARRYHPDLNPGDAIAEECFKEVQAAYALLTDPEQRRRYDEGELDQDFAESINVDDVDFSSLFQELFGNGWSPSRGGANVGFQHLAANLDHTITLRVPSAVKTGTRLAATTADNRRVQFTLPEGAGDGSVLRLKGKGYEFAGEHGDLYVRLQFV